MTELFTDRMVASVVEHAMQSDRIDYDIARALAREFPEASGLSISFALTAAASGLADMSPDSKVPALYKLAAMVAADLFAFEARGEQRPNAAALLRLWITELPR